MDSKLATYLDQQDKAYATYLRGDQLASKNDERIYLMREISCIEKHLANDESDNLVTPAQWYDRLVECRTRLRRILEREHETLARTIHLHSEGLVKCNTRQIELEAQLEALEVS